ncbi:MAG: acyltransferase [Ruminococcus flavefaciens]|nr:acyltransferase [Ruminococcus flavefaciens]
MKKIESLQALRAFAALSVVLTHMSFIESGSFGVDIFFIISGFLMMYSTEKGTGEGYWKKKIRRIVPFYWIMTIITAMAVKVMPDLFNSYEVSLMYLIKSLFFIPYEHSGIYQPVLGLGYTLNYEMLFYVLFYISAKIAEKTKLMGRGVICSVIILGLTGLRNMELPMPFAFWCNAVMLDFVLGIFLYYLFRLIDLEKWLQTESRMRSYLCGVSLLFAAVFLWVIPVPASETRIFVWGLPSMFLFVVVYIFYYGKNVPSVILLIGNISYYIYLTHPYCVRLTEKVVGKICSSGVSSHVLMAFTGVSASVMCGYVTYRAYSMAESWIRKSIHKRNAAQLKGNE